MHDYICLIKPIYKQMASVNQTVYLCSPVHLLLTVVPIDTLCLVG